MASSQHSHLLKSEQRAQQENAPPAAERDEQNKAAFLLAHFFDDVELLLEPPTIAHRVDGGSLDVSRSDSKRIPFKENLGVVSGRTCWLYNRPPEGSTGYLREMIPNNWAEITCDKETARIGLDTKAFRFDFFNNHRKTICRGSDANATCVSCPYARVKLTSQGMDISR